MSEKILEQHRKTHGDFSIHASVTQGIKSIINAHMAKNNSTVQQQEALDMIAHNIGRIVAGDPHFMGHWDDIAWYATLVSKELE